jgi:hypothetical protein
MRFKIRLVQWKATDQPNKYKMISLKMASIIMVKPWVQRAYATTVTSELLPLPIDELNEQLATIELSKTF